MGGVKRAACIGLCACALGACDDGRQPPRFNVYLPPAGAGGAGGQVFQGSNGANGTGGNSLIADPDGPCDDELALDSDEARDAARALGLCKDKNGSGDWGVVDASWVLPDGSAPQFDDNFHLGHGILSGFGDDIEALEGDRILALSSGAARAPSDEGYASPAGFDKLYTSDHPEGFPKEAPACLGEEPTGIPHDGIALEVVLQPPPDAISFSFSFDFYTYEWPDYICTTYNDHFLALLSPAPSGAPDGNVSFDQEGNVVSVNNALLRVCGCDGGPPCAAGNKEFECELGDGELDNTGFETRAATSWLVTTAPIDPDEEITLRWTVYDSADGILDSTTLIDRFRWLGVPQTDPETIPEIK